MATQITKTTVTKTGRDKDGDETVEKHENQQEMPPATISSPEKGETIEDLGIGAQDPYPTADDPAPEQKKRK